MEDCLRPFVYWGQTSASVSLRVELQDVTVNNVDLTEDRLEIILDGKGAMGQNQYGFELDFYLPINAEDSKLRVTDRGVEINIKKQGEEVWPRLTEKQVRLLWLKIDFDKFPVDEDIEETDEAEEQRRAEEMAKQIEKELQLESEEKPLPFKMYYMFFYNLLQFVGFLFIVFGLSYNFLRHGADVKEQAFLLAGSQMIFCQTLAVLEVIHPMVGLVKTGVLAPVMQVMGRNFILFALILQDVRLQVAPAAWYLFMTWGTVELVRYPFYMFASLGMDVKIITWLRYTAWIPLYPLGLLFESVIVIMAIPLFEEPGKVFTGATQLGKLCILLPLVSAYLLLPCGDLMCQLALKNAPKGAHLNARGVIVIMAIPLFEESGRFSLALPNSANFAFYFPWFLHVYLLIIAIAGCKMIMHMYHQRKKRLYPAGISKKSL